MDWTDTFPLGSIPARGFNSSPNQTHLKATAEEDEESELLHPL